MSNVAKIAVLASGSGTNLQAVIDAERLGAIKSGSVKLVVATKQGAYARTRAEEAGIKAVTIVKKELGSQEAFEAAILNTLFENRIDVIVLAGFMNVLSESFVRRFPNRIINVHAALIPSFCGDGFYGLKVHEAALNYGVKVSGATVHYVNEVTDGGEIILQKAVDVLPGDTPQTLQDRIKEQAEWDILPRAVEIVCAKALEEAN